MGLQHEDILRAKGWSAKEISDTKKILRKIEKRKHPHRQLVQSIAYWLVIILAMMTTVGISIWVIPVFVYANASLLYPILIIIALVFGMLFANTVQDLDHLTSKHHALLSAIIPLVGIVSFLIVIGQTNQLAPITGQSHNALLVGVIFTVFFITPYLYHVNTKA
jgi:predicted ferric reductase